MRINFVASNANAYEKDYSIYFHLHAPLPADIHRIMYNGFYTKPYV